MAHAVLASLGLQVPSSTLAIGVRTEPLRYEHGLFDHARPELGVRVADDGLYPGLTLLHEVGHALDHAVLGEGRGYASEDGQGPTWNAWRAATVGSDALRAVRRHLLDPDFPDEAAFAAYLLEPREVFARAFAQLTVELAGTPELRADIAALAQREPPQQWAPGDFARVRTATAALVGAPGGAG